MTMNESAQRETQTRVHEGGSMLESLLILVRHKKLVAVITMAGSVLVLAVSLLLPKIYTGTALILPPQQGSSSLASAALGQLGALAAVMPSSLTLKKQNDVYVGMLKSRSLADRLIQRFGLQQRYDQASLVKTREELAQASQIFSTREGLIAIEVEDEDPGQAAVLANAYVEELVLLMRTLGVTEASRRRLFFEKQVEQAKNTLAEAELSLKKVQDRTGIIELKGQTQAIIAAISQLKARIAAKEAALSAMRTFSTERNPELMTVKGEVAGLRAELARMEKNGDALEGDVFVPTGKLSEGGLEYLRRLRDLRYQETLFELLAKQYELARVDEARDFPLIQVVDQATPPDRKTSPKYLLNGVVGMLASFCLGIFAAFAREALDRAKRDPERSRVLAQIGEALRH